MLNENIRTKRKQKGYTQEEFAARLNVVRQTVSKWEKGLSVPDAEMLIKISELLDISAGDLLGASIPDNMEQTDIAKQLERVNEQLAIRNRRSKLIMKIALGIVAGIIAINILIICLSAVYTVDSSKTTIDTEQHEAITP